MIISCSLQKSIQHICNRHERRIFALAIGLIICRTVQAADAAPPNTSFEREIKLGSVVAYQHRAEKYKDLHEYQKALKEFGQAIHLEPKNAKLYSERGGVYEVMNKYPEAIEDFSKAIELKPKAQIV